MKNLKNSLAVVLLACSGTLLFPNAAKAVSTIDFGVKSPTSGSLSYAGGAAPLTGAGIEVDDVVGLDTPLNNNVFATCVACTLEFETGASTGGWDFGAGGTISIIGGIDFPDATPDIAAGNTLLFGTFDSATIIQTSVSGFVFQIVGGSFTDTKHPDLVAFYGLPDVDYVGGLNISFTTTASMGDAFTTSDITSGDILNQPVPVPAAVWLFGSGLIGLIGIARRKKA